MRDIAIVGAGELGGALAHTLARRNAATVIRLVDDQGRVAEGKALDMTQAAPVEGFATEVSGSTELMMAGGSDVVIIADRVGAGEWQGEEGVLLLRRLVGFAPSAVIVCAGASQRELIERGVRELHLDRRRILGSAPEALASAARALVALAVDGSPQDVSVSVLGRPPAQTIIPWDDTAIGGYRLTRLLDEPTRRRLDARIAAMWPPGPHTLAAAAGKAVDALFGRSRTLMSCFVAPDDSAGERARTVALPVRLGLRGVEAIVLPSLNVVDRVALDNAMML
jgi:malate dehydrogenase